MNDVKYWTPPPVAADSRIWGGRSSLPAKMVLGMVAVGAVALVIASFQMAREALSPPQTAIAYTRFDPAYPPALGDPAPQIAAHLRALAGDEIIPSAVQREIDDFTRGTRDTLPSRLDDITTLVGVQSVGRRVAMDNRVMLSRPVADLDAFRTRLRADMEPALIAKLCMPSNADIGKFLRENNITLTYAFTLNDGNPPLFIDLPPEFCSR